MYIVCSNNMCSLNLLENSAYSTGNALDYKANVLVGIRRFVCCPYKYSVKARGTTATHKFVCLMMVGMPNCAHLKQIVCSQPRLAHVQTNVTSTMQIAW